MDLAIGVLLGSAIAWSTILVLCWLEQRKLEQPPDYLGPWCAECDRGFSEWDWENRHTREDGEDVHAECCLANRCEVVRYAA
jgi:hypothetical protein